MLVNDLVKIYVELRGRQVDICMLLTHESSFLDVVAAARDVRHVAAGRTTPRRQLCRAGG
jgi:hypothetical protein